MFHLEYMQWSAMVCDAPKGLKLQKNALFYCIVWPALFHRVTNIIKSAVDLYKPLTANLSKLAFCWRMTKQG